MAVDASSTGIQAARDPVTGLCRLALARLPTPLEAAPRLAAELGIARLWIKREDQSGYALGGNKLRKIDFILAEALGRGADTLVATAGAQSNFCRALAGAAAKAGLSCHLHLRGRPASPPQGNLLLDHVFGARLSFTSATDPWDPTIRRELDGIADRLLAEGRRPHVVQLTGATAGLAAAAWVSGAAELVGDWKAAGTVPHTTVVACGSGLTHAGLSLGLRNSGLGTRVIGISVQQTAARLKPWIAEAADRAASLLGIAARLTPGDIAVLDDQVGPGYGVPSAASIEAVRLAGRTEALVLDPIYTGKALAGLAAAVSEGLIGRHETVTFLHSGGTPGLFAHAGSFAGVSS